VYKGKGVEEIAKNQLLKKLKAKGAKLKALIWK